MIIINNFVKWFAWSELTLQIITLSNDDTDKGEEVITKKIILLSN